MPQPADLTNETPLILGWREYVALPAWRVGRLRAKLDTGARTSALHVENVTCEPDDRVSFDVVETHRPPHRRVRVTTNVVRWARVKSSNGQLDQRPVVVTTLKLGEVERQIEITLVDRGNMLCRMLLGRRALDHGVRVDPGRKYLLGRPRRRKSP